MNLRQSTAATIIVGPILDADGVAKTDEVVGSIKIHKNGAAAAALNGSATLTHSQTGYYRLALTADDLDTLGTAEFTLNNGTNSMPVKEVNVITQDAWDALHHATDGKIRGDLTFIHGTALTETDGQLAGRFVNFFDQASATFSVATALADFKASGFATLANQAAVLALLQNATYGLAKLARTGADGDTLETLSDQLDGLASLSGEGAFTGTLTVQTSGGTKLEGVVVNARRGGVLKASGTTDVNGQITNWVFGAYTYDLSVRLDGYQPATDQIAVSANDWTKTIILAQLSFDPPADTDKVTAWGYVYDEDTVLEESAVVYIQQLTAGSRKIYDSAIKTLTSNAQGVVSCSVWADGSTYRISRDGETWSEEFTPEDDEDEDLPQSYRLPGFVGDS